MNRTLFLWILLLGFPLYSWASKPLKPFSEMEMNHVRVKNPAAFARGKEVILHLAELKEHQYAFPLPGAKVISGYGARNGHSGADIKTKARDTIRCVFDGVVRMAKSYGGYGKIRFIRHFE